MNCFWIDFNPDFSFICIVFFSSSLVFLQNVLPLHHSFHEVLVTHPFHKSILFYIAQLHPNLYVFIWWHKFHFSYQSISLCHHFRCLINRDSHFFFIFVLVENFICMIQYFWISRLLGSFYLFSYLTFRWCKGVFFTWKKIACLRSPWRKEL